VDTQSTAHTTKRHALSLGARVLQACCRPVEAPEYVGGTITATVDNALDFLVRAVPDFMAITARGSILDFGCGFGLQAAALARLGGDVTGLDLPRDVFTASWRRLMEAYPTLRLTTEVPSRTFDVIYSCSSFEHFADPSHVLTLMRERLKPDGVLVIAFAEPWFSPRGHHMGDFTRLPWVNLLFREADVMTVRASYHPDGATRYEEVEGGLNRMTVGRFERLMCDSGMRVRSLRRIPVKNLPVVTRIPMLRELFTASCSAVLEERGIRGRRDESWPVARQ
jgi:SAM-dependent methyltransferase